MINFYKSIDNLLGVVLYVFFRFKKNIFVDLEKIYINKILLIKFWGLGNLALIWPLINKIKEKYPDSFITFLTFDINKAFLEKNQTIDRIIYFKFPKNIFQIIYRFISMLAALRKEKIDLVINFETFNNTSALFSYLVKAPLRIGLNNKSEKVFYNYWFCNNPSQHITEKFLNLLSPLGINSAYRYHLFKESEVNENKIKHILNKFKIKGFICIHPGTSEFFKEGRRLNQEKFSELSNMLIDKYSLPLIFTGTEKEKELIRNIIEKIIFKDKVFNFAGYLRIWEFIELLKRCLLFISNDTGTVHIAASLGINIAVFYGQSSPDRCRPLNENSVILYKHLKCSPCTGVLYRNAKCKNNYICLDFSPQEVFTVISNKFFNA